MSKVRNTNKQKEKCQTKVDRKGISFVENWKMALTFSRCNQSANIKISQVDFLVFLLNLDDLIQKVLHPVYARKPAAHRPNRDRCTTCNRGCHFKKINLTSLTMNDRMIKCCQLFFIPEESTSNQVAFIYSFIEQEAGLCIHNVSVEVVW